MCVLLVGCRVVSHLLCVVCHLLLVVSCMLFVVCCHCGNVSLFVCDWWLVGQCLLMFAVACSSLVMFVVV